MRRKTRSLRSHFLILYVVLAILSGIVVPILGVKFSAEAFRNYQIQRRQADLENLGESLSALYKEEGGVWKRRRVMDILRPAPQWGGMVITLFDSNGREVYTLKPRMTSVMNNAETELLTINLSQDAGRLEIQRRLPSGRFENSYLRYLLSYTLGGALIMIIFACAVGYFVAGRLSRPVIQAIERTKNIAKGDYDVPEESERIGIRELDDLTRGVKDLGRSLSGQEKLRRRLMIDVAHELRTPLTVTRTQIEAIADGILEPTPERLSLCVNEMTRLADLIGNIDVLSRIEGETLRLNLEVTDMKKFLSIVAESFKPVFAKSKIELSTELENASCEIDREKFRHVIDNLLSNALRYTDEGGRVKIKLSTKNNEVRFTISDTGIGISPEDLPNIFERFWRADESRTRVTGGSGVGLAIVKATVEAHGGKIFAESVKGEGSCFTVILRRA